MVVLDSTVVSARKGPHSKCTAMQESSVQESNTSVEFWATALASPSPPMHSHVSAKTRSCNDSGRSAADHREEHGNATREGVEPGGRHPRWAVESPTPPNMKGHTHQRHQRLHHIVAAP
mmetsp:Transcript_38185/g.98683  ORF Transcript_38185/g.98683 Transcript_38185/m.98683 type:complete len:119 (+) Transcript_38185:142-498(+)